MTNVANLCGLVKFKLNEAKTRLLLLYFNCIEEGELYYDALTD